MALSRPDAGWHKLIERCLFGVADSFVADTLGAASGAGASGSGASGSGAWQPDAKERRAAATRLLDQAGAALGRYLDLVLQWNARVDLTAARDNNELVDLFLADAALLALAPQAAAPGQGVAPNSAEHWVDVGTGAGAPGLPLKVLRPELQVELVEPKAKRVAFLRTVASTLAMTGLEIRRLRSEEVEDTAFDVALSRATFSPDLWLAEGARISRGSIWVLLAQGDAPTLEGYRTQLSAEYRWPLTGVSRRALRFVRAE